MRDMREEFLKEASESGRGKNESRKTSTWQMFLQLRRIFPSDCHLSLFGEFLLRPNVLKDRYNEEMVFQNNLEAFKR